MKIYKAASLLASAVQITAHPQLQPAKFLASATFNMTAVQTFPVPGEIRGFNGIVESVSSDIQTIMSTSDARFDVQRTGVRR